MSTRPLAEVEKDLEDCDGTANAVSAVLENATAGESAAGKALDDARAAHSVACEGQAAAKRSYAEKPDDKKTEAALDAADSGVRRASVLLEAAQEKHGAAIRAVATAKAALARSAQSAATVAAERASHPEVIRAKVEPHALALLKAVEDARASAEAIDRELAVAAATGGLGHRLDAGHAWIPILQALNTRGIALSEDEIGRLRHLVTPVGGPSPSDVLGALHGVVAELGTLTQKPPSTSAVALKQSRELVSAIGATRTIHEAFNLVAEKRRNAPVNPRRYGAAPNSGVAR